MEVTRSSQRVRWLPFNWEVCSQWHTERDQGRRVWLGAPKGVQKWVFRGSGMARILDLDHPDLDSPAHFYDVIRFGGLEIWRGLDLDGSGSWMPRIDS